MYQVLYEKYIENNAQTNFNAIFKKSSTELQIPSVAYPLHHS